MVPVFVSLLSGVAVVSLLMVDAPRSPSALDGHAIPAARATEVARIRAHFDSVLSELPAHSATGLTAAQLARRADLLLTLRQYRNAGSFPHNYDFPGQPTPYFVDRKTGVLCAVAHLLESTGRRDIVDRVAGANNNVYVAQLADDTAFTRWLDQHGLTLDEAARIQVPYMGEFPNPDIIVEPKSNTAAYSIGTAVAVTGSVAASLWSTYGNRDGHRRVSNLAGLAASAVSIGLGSAALSDRSAPRAVAPLSILAGGVSAYFSTRGLFRHKAYRAAQRDAARETRVALATVSPILPVAGRSGAGVAMRLSF
jgi:hypothetical protein